jgi:hypothetical protein
MHGHFVSKGSDFHREPISDLGAKSFGPLTENINCGAMKSLCLCIPKARRELERREPSTVKNLIGVGVADTTENSRVGEGAFEGVALAGDGRQKTIKISVQNLESSRIVERSIAGLILLGRRGMNLTRLTANG